VTRIVGNGRVVRETATVIRERAPVIETVYLAAGRLRSQIASAHFLRLRDMKHS